MASILTAVRPHGIRSRGHDSRITHDVCVINVRPVRRLTQAMIATDTRLRQIDATLFLADGRAIGTVLRPSVAVCRL